MSLRDQLQKSGLLTPEQMKKADRAVSKVQHSRDLDVRTKKSDAALLEAEQKKAEEIELDRKHVEKEQAIRDIEVVNNRTIDVIRRGELRDPMAKDSYFFTLPDGKIEKIPVNDIQSMQLAAGDLAIVFLEPENRYVLLSRKNVEKIFPYHPQYIVCFHRPRV